LAVLFPDPDLLEVLVMPAVVLSPLGLLLLVELECFLLDLPGLEVALVLGVGSAPVSVAVDSSWFYFLRNVDLIKILVYCVVSSRKFQCKLLCFLFTPLFL